MALSPPPSTQNRTRSPKVKAIFFDFMGTCLDWHAPVSASFPSSFSPSEASNLAIEWRRQYFISNSVRLSQSLPPEDIDATLTRTLKQVVADSSKLTEPQKSDLTDPGAIQQLIYAWHSQPAWPEVPSAIRRLKTELNLETFVHANGTTRLQLDLVRSSGLAGHFDMLFSSQLLGVYKPHPEAYRKALELVRLRPEEVVMVAAHAHDLRGAREVGMRTVYVRRWTDDVDEDLVRVSGEVDYVIESMKGLAEVVSGLI